MSPRVRLGVIAVVLTVTMLGASVAVGRAFESPHQAVSTSPAAAGTQPSSASAVSGGMAMASTSAPTALTTSSTSSPATLGTLAGRVIVLDPGHNGGNAAHLTQINALVDVITEKKPCDTTGTETSSGYTESTFNLDVAERVQALLEGWGARVTLTRTDNSGVGPCITERAAIGNRAHADAAVSIHADGGPVTGRGFHVIEPVDVPGHNDAIITPSSHLGADLATAYQAATGLPRSTYLGVDGIDYRNDLGGLNLSTVPKVFIECGNMRNDIDASALRDAGFRQRVATGIANGINQFLAGS